MKQSMCKWNDSLGTVVGGSSMYQSWCTIEWQGHLPSVYMECVVSALPISAELMTDFRLWQFYIYINTNMLMMIMTLLKFNVHHKKGGTSPCACNLGLNIPVPAERRTF